MRRYLLLLAAFAILPGCSRDSAKSDTAKANGSGGSGSEKTLTAREQFNELMKVVAADGLEWNQKYDAAESAADRVDLERDRPTARHAAKFLELGRKADDPIVAQQALDFALTNGEGKVADSAGAALLKNIASSTDPEDAEANLALVLTVLKNSGGETRVSAARQLMTQAGDLQTDESVDAINHVLQSGLDATILADVTDRVLEVAGSDEAGAGIGACLASIAEYSPDTTKVDAAMNLLTSKPANRSALQGLLKGFTSRPSQQSEDRLTAVCETLEGAPQAQALLALSEYSKAVTGLRSRFAGKPERVPPNYSATQREYLAQKSDGGLSQTTEKLMTSFVESNKGNAKYRQVVARVGADLFVLKNLSVGKQAPEIAAADLDGTEFKLSDYRGKVVFLDFWGDW